MFAVTIPDGTLRWAEGEGFTGDPALVEQAQEHVRARTLVYGTATGPQIVAGDRTEVPAYCVALRVVEDREWAADGPSRPPVWEGDTPTFDTPDGAVS